MPKRLGGIKGCKYSTSFYFVFIIVCILGYKSKKRGSGNNCVYRTLSSLLVMFGGSTWRLMYVTVEQWTSPRHCIVDPKSLPSGNPFKCHVEVLSLQPMKK